MPFVHHRITLLLLHHIALLPFHHHSFSSTITSLPIVYHTIINLQCLQHTTSLPLFTIPSPTKSPLRPIPHPQSLCHSSTIPSNCHSSIPITLPFPHHPHPAIPLSPYTLLFPSMHCNFQSCNIPPPYQPSTAPSSCQSSRVVDS